MAEGTMPSGDLYAGDRLIEIHNELMERTRAVGLDNLPMLMPLGVFTLQLAMMAFVEAEHQETQRQVQGGHEAFFLGSAVSTGSAAMLAAVHVIHAHLTRMPSLPPGAEQIEDTLEAAREAAATLARLAQVMRLLDGPSPVRPDA